jgi:excisionase family DNA binding protein
MHVDEPAIPLEDPGGAAANGSRGSRATQSTLVASGGDSAEVTEEILTYPEAARLLKISARTLERWTREGLVPYIRLPQRGRWSGVRFSRSELLRWLRRRTVRAR